MTSTPRLTQPRTWATLALASVTLAMPAQSNPHHPPPTALPMANLWLAQAEGGEGGEAGAVAEFSGDAAYLAQLSIVEGHLAAAATMYRKGLVDEAIGLSYHPEAEIMDHVRETLAAHGAPDISPAMVTFSETMERGATPDEVDQALAALSAAVATASQPAKADLPGRFSALVIVLRAAASEYADSTAGGLVNDITPYYEAHGFVAVARSLAQTLAADPAADPKAAAAAQKALLALNDADAAFGDLAHADPVARDPAILQTVAARVELIASSVR